MKRSHPDDNRLPAGAVPEACPDPAAASSQDVEWVATALRASR